MKIQLRFVHGEELSSDLIEWREGTAMPFAPSHVECVTPEGLYLGQRADGGMQARHPGYDGAKPADEFFIGLPATDAESATFYADAKASIGEPYDWQAILGYVLPGHFHAKDHAICSAKMVLLLRAISWFPSRAPLAVPAHCIDPRDLLLIISAVIPLKLSGGAT